jgi:hypothetical protein
MPSFGGRAQHEHDDEHDSPTSESGFSLAPGSAGGPF